MNGDGSSGPSGAGPGEGGARGGGSGTRLVLVSAALGALAALPAALLEVGVQALGATRRSTPDPVGALEIYVAHGVAAGLLLALGWLALARALGRPVVPARDARATGLVVPGVGLLVLCGGYYANHVALPGVMHPLSLAANGILLAASAALCLLGIRRVARVPAASAAPRGPWAAVAAGAVLAAAAGVPFALRFLPPSVPQSDRPAALAESVEPLPGGPPFGDDVPVFVILIDTLRADHLGIYGYERDTSPALARLAADGVVYTTGYSTSSWTVPSVASLFSGLYPTSHTVVEAWSVLPDEVHTLAEMLSALGIPTAAFIANPLVDEPHGYLQGMDTVFPAPAPHWYRTHPNAIQLVYQAVFSGSGQRTGPSIFRMARSWLAERESDRFFAYLHLFEPHAPYRPPGDFARRYDPDWEGPPVEIYPERRPDRSRPPLPPDEHENIVAQYDGEIAYLDTLFDDFFDHLEAEGLYDRALIVLVADHGEEFYDHQLWGHDDNAHQELTRVPFVIKWPEGRWAGTRVEAPVQLVDVPATVLHVLGHRPAAPQHGRSLLAPLQDGGRGDPGLDGRAAFVETRSWHGVRTRDWRYIVRRDAEPGSGRLYARDDVREQEDVADRHPEVVAELERRRAEWLERLGEVQVQEQSVPLDEARREQLRELGYLDE